ncbi:hypothetical protein HN018_17370 [Lichenicola cladoniae]|uniref:Lipoprotein n=1 Tax=Lichenicola cladoniae TaxID=1484109 RepID=A0A6M8HTS7_9PROT|nr:hypothetical protein [Lichenicola cladoniae]NPD65346.1 hypothetical protein [Acetobacteraceae bacterium]QKE91567.1 hypothetical protein HN018_17370 [Lichenicola cladoniae]
MDLLAMRRPRDSSLRLCLGLTSLTAIMLLAGCGGDSRSEPVFKQPSYTYLTPLRINVGQIQVEDHVPPPTGPNDLGPSSPVSPDQALKQMAQDRLVAAGSSGTAVFTIDQASITGQPGGALDGAMAVHLDIVSNGGGHAGYAEAHVSRQFVPGSNSDNDGVKAELYNLTTQMMQDMNVEFEFQLRRTLGDWMLDASGAPVAASVEQQSLTGPGASPASAPANQPSSMMPPASVGAPMQLAPPPGAIPAGQPLPQGPVPGAPASTGPDAVDPTAAPGPIQLSPPPSFLQAPPGASSPVAPSSNAAPAPTNLAPAGYPVPPGYHPGSQGTDGPTSLAPAPSPAYPTPPGYHPTSSTADQPPTGSGY